MRGEIQVYSCSELYFMCASVLWHGSITTAGRLKSSEGASLISTDSSTVPVESVFQRGGILLSAAELQQYLGSVFSRAASLFSLVWPLWLVESDSTSHQLCTRVKDPRLQKSSSSMQNFISCGGIF